ncbi:HET-domain-containing protein, partial [Cryphonectria parasitica EP155]
SDEAFHRVTKWLKDCTRHHTSCSVVETSLPTYTLDVGSVDTAEELRLVENKNGTAKGLYVALSYVWGVPFEEDLRQLYLCTGNKHDYLDRVPEEKLPQTLQDAVFATRKLGIRYLWIDALCIIQDDKEFKKKEIMNMHRIFGDSHLTIQAAFTQTVYKGFLSRRTRHALSDQRLLYSRNSRTDSLSSTDEACVFLRPAVPSVQEGPAGTRAWCYEEAVLPKRLLVYGKEQMHYSCVDSGIWEGGSREKRGIYSTIRASRRAPWFEGIPIPPTARTPDLKLDSLKLWYWALDIFYTPRFLTRPADRLAAIAGVVRWLQNEIPGEYQVGLWTVDLPWGLLWTTRRGLGIKFRTRYRAPSWSWASV